MNENKDKCKPLEEGYKRYLSGLSAAVQRASLENMNVEQLLHSTFGLNKLLTEYHSCSKDESVSPMVNASNRMMEDVLRLVTTKIGYDKVKDIRGNVNKAVQALQALNKSIESGSSTTSFDGYKKKILDYLNKIK